MENNDFLDTNINHGGLTITSDIRDYLKETAKWGKLLSIVGFVMMAILVVFALFAGTIMATAMSQLDSIGGAGALGGGMISVIYILMALLYFFPLLYLYRFSSKIQVALNSDDQQYLSEAFRNLKSLYKFMGILMAIMLCFYALAIVMALAGGALAMVG